MTADVANSSGLVWKDVIVPKPFSKEFREHAVRVAKNRDKSVTLEQIAKDFGIHIGTLDNWMCQDRIEHGEQSGASVAASAELRDLRRRDRLLE